MQNRWTSQICRWLMMTYSLKKKVFPCHPHSSVQNIGNSSAAPRCNRTPWVWYIPTSDGCNTMSCALGPLGGQEAPPRPTGRPTMAPFGVASFSATRCSQASNLRTLKGGRISHAENEANHRQRLQIQGQWLEHVITWSIEFQPVLDLLS